MSVRTITPEIAFAMLRNNECGRVLNLGRVAQYAERMRSGQWVDPGSDNIALKPPEGGWGALVDGQHRLHAIILANQPMQHGIVTAKDDPEWNSTFLGNSEAEDGCDRCECGCKYWRNDHCFDCGTKFDPARHRP